MKFTFPVIIKKKQADSLGETIIIPQLATDIVLTPQHHESIKQHGMQFFLIQEIINFLREKENHKEEIHQPDMIDKVLEAYMKPNKHHNLGPHDINLVIHVDYDSILKQYHFFKRTLPILSKTTLFLEIAFATISQIGALELSEGVIPMSHDAHEVMSFTQAILSALFICFLVFLGPGQAFMEDFGKLLDDVFTNPCKTKKHDEEADTQLSFKTKSAIRVIKSLLSLFVFNFLWTSAIQDYQNALSLSTRIAAQDNSVLPPKLVFICAWSQFGLNQFNDPLNILSTVLIGFRIIDTYFINKYKPVSQVQIEDLSEAKEEASMTNTMQETLSPSAVKGLLQFGALSPRRHANNLAEIITDDFSQKLDTPLLKSL
ncbi:MAG: hypothetical protein P4M12_06535 [Gammaproteobacteria bacterium]|nr:hypothetical protein [Gammaproteobacteria bacterium]